LGCVSDHPFFDFKAEKIRKFYPWYTQALHSLTTEASKKYKVDHAVLVALIQHESWGKRRARGKPVYYPKLGITVRARGYMQIMPVINYKGPASDLDDPRLNIMWGTRYFAYCLRLAKGNYRTAIKNYNSGPGSKFFNRPHIRKIIRDSQIIRKL
jgi:soluble lytic murein transglycosylase-like protein